MRHAGLHLPNGPGDYDAIARLPGSAFLILATEARYHYGRLRQARPDALWVWRAIPRHGRRPAELGYDPSRMAGECLNLWEEQAHGGREHFLALNELNLNYERGDGQDDFQGLYERYRMLASFLDDLKTNLRGVLGTGVDIHFPPWAPGHYEWEHAHLWAPVADTYQVVHFHAYGTAEEQETEYRRYRSALPGKALFCGEWNTGGRGVEEDRRALEMWARVCAEDPLLLGVTYFVWHWYDGWSDQFNVDDNPARLALFATPPVAAVAPPQPPPVPEPDTEPIETPEPPPEPQELPMTEYEQFVRDEAARRGIDPDTAVIVANSEGSLTEPARLGDFSGPPWHSGKSWWAFQLHYGGDDYAEWGGSAGMGNSFTRDTGWAPGDPNAWRDAARYALDAVKRGGWGPWYGAAARGITGFDGIDRSAPWDGTPAEEWDYRQQEAPTMPHIRDVLSVARSRTGDPYVWDGEQPGGFDCSGLWAWAFGQVGVRLTSYTDTVYGECEPVTDERPGYLIFYDYADANQPNTRFPHMGVFLGDGRAFESRYPRGVGEYDVLTYPYELRRVPGVALDDEPAEPEEEDMARIAELEAEVARLEAARADEEQRKNRLVEYLAVALDDAIVGALTKPSVKRATKEQWREWAVQARAEAIDS